MGELRHFLIQVMMQRFPLAYRYKVMEKQLSKDTSEISVYLAAILKKWGPGLVFQNILFNMHCTGKMQRNTN